MNTYLIVIVRDSDEVRVGTGSEVVEFRVIDNATPPDAKAACAAITDRRPLYEAFAVKLS